MIIKLAGKIIQINHLYPYVCEYCKDYLYDANEDQIDFMIEINKSDIEAERRKSEKEAIREKRNVRKFSDEYLETLAVYRKIAEHMLDYDTLLFHGSVVAVDDQGYLFTATSGTGKSTHVGLWRKVFKERAVMVNDDKPLLAISKNGVLAYGTPWNGTHRLSGNVAVPLKSICILQRDTINHIEPVNRREAYPMIVQQTNRAEHPLQMQQTLQLIDRLLDQTALYRLGCNMELEAARIAFEGMQ